MEKGNQKRRGRRGQRKFTSGLLAGLLALALTLGLAPGGSVYAAGVTWSVDPSTAASWSEGDLGTKAQGDATKNAGRVWTDKTVHSTDAALDSGSSIENDEDTALVQLSALSSAAVISGTEMVNQPLDIVLVLDVSGSMAEPFGAVYANELDTEETYYIEDSYGTVHAVTYQSRSEKWGYSGSYGRWNEVTPKQSADSRWGTQFYTSIKIDALQEAVNNFIRQTADQNDQITDENRQHRISLVKYAGDSKNSIGNDTYDSGWYTYNNSQIVSDLRIYTSNNENTLINTVNGLDPAGATRADYGLAHAERVLNGEGSLTGARENAQKVVIFFTDGVPTESSSFSNSVAGSAINTAYDMKQDDTLIYSIGVLEDADPTDTSSAINRFLNAVSSNYENAECYDTNRWGRKEQRDNFEYLHMGDRAPADEDYYYTADDAESLSEVFRQISQSIPGRAYSPITGTSAGEDGYLTFTDILGDYTEVKDMKSIVVNGTSYTQKTSTTDENLTTYTFTADVGQVNAVYAETQNLSDIVITVQKTGADDLQTGDTVTVQIPDTLLPLRMYSAAVDAQGEVTTSVEETSPISVFYTVGLKEGVLDSSGNLNTDAISEDYLNAHTDANGKIVFYSNNYNGTGSSAIAEGGSGTTTVTFQPAASNDFYYFTEDAPIYTKEGDKYSPANTYTAGGTYYYQRTYYANDEEKQEWVAFTAQEGQTDENGPVRQNDEGSYYIVAGSPRLTRPTEFVADKMSNVTATATQSISSSWKTDDQIEVVLGNNGKVTFDVPASLIITKEVTAGAGLTAPDAAFTFTVTAEEKADQTVTAVLREDGKADESKIVEFDENGEAEIQLEAGQSIELKGMSGVEYSIEEKELPDGFEVSEIKVNGTEVEEAAGNIGTDDVTVAFKNTYSASGTSGVLTGTKKISGRDFKTGDAFTFEVTGNYNGDAGSIAAPMPSKVVNGEITINPESGKTADISFGTITFTAPGTYTYTISEKAVSGISGVENDTTVYTVTYIVTDKNANGTLEVSDPVYAVQGAETSGQLIWENTYTPENVTIGENTSNGIRVQKTLTGRDWIASDSFIFKLKPVTSGAPMPDPDTITVTAEPGTEENTLVTAWFGDITYTKAALGEAMEKTFEYQVFEQGTGSGGLTYDTHTATVKVTVSDDGNGTLSAEVKYNNIAAAGTDQDVTTAAAFTNRYASEGTLVGQDNLEVTKNFSRSDGAWLSADSFTFELAPDMTDAVTKAAVEAGQIQLQGAASSMEVTIKADSPEHKAAFGDITFTAEGTYKFVVKEKMPAGAVEENNYTVDGIHYDSSAKNIVVKVEDKDNNGTLTVTVESESDELAFSNTYSTGTAELSGTANLEVQKVIKNRDWIEGDSFTFRLAAGDETTSDAIEAGQIELPVNAAQGITIAYEEDQSAEAYKAAFGDIRFTKAGTYQFLVTEDVNPAATNESVDGGQTVYSEASSEQQEMTGWTYQGITYDNTPKTVQVDVTDDGKGQLSASVVKESSDELIFTNTYTSGGTVEVGGEGEAQIELSKVLSGKEWTAEDEFTFTIAPHEDTPEAPMPEETKVTVAGSNATLQTEGDYAGAYRAEFGFGSITYSKEGSYKYVVTEEKGANEGIDYSANEITVTVEVSDDLHGGLKAGVTYAGTGTMDAQVFVNEYGTELTYSPESDSGLVIEKTLKDHSIAEGQFEFTVTAVGDSSKELLGGESKVVRTTAANMNTDTGNAAVTIPVFEGLTFTQENDFLSDEPEYTFTVQETKGGSDGYENDTASYTVTISVEDDGNGTLTVTTNVKGTEVDETYISTSTGTKAIAKIPFNNTYRASTGEEGEVNEESVVIKAAKTLTGRDMDAEEFEFQVAAISEEKGEKVYASGTNSAAAEDNAADITFTPINYTKEGLNQDVRDGYALYEAVNGKDTYTYDYIVSEATEGLAEEGIQLSSSNDLHVTVTVTDENNGKLTTEVAYPEAGLAFVNSYHAEDAQLELSAYKKIDADAQLNAPELQGNEFSFTVTGVDENGNEAPLPDDSQGYVTAWNGPDGSVKFGTITYEFDELFGDEQAAEGTEVTEPETEPEAGVTEPEAGLENDVTEPEADPENDVTESETDPENDVTESETDPENDVAESETDPKSDVPEAEMPTEEDTEGTDPKATGTDETVIDKENPEVTEGVTTEAEGADGETSEEASVSAVEINALNAAPGMKAGGENTRTFIYTIKEAGELPGVENDSDKQFKVVVTDDGEGHLTAEALTMDGQQLPAGFFTFTNTYSVTPTTDTPTGDGNGLTITKKVTGRALVDKEFDFELVNERTNEVVAEGTNDANGNVELSGITFEEPGTYSYILREKAGTAGGVSYDTASYKVSAVVTDNSDGTMSVAWKYGENEAAELEAVFQNTYTAAPTSVTLGAVKRLDGRTLAAGEFTFRLTDESGKVVSEAKNDANGAISFGTLTFDKAGTYKYTVTEVKGTAANVTYDGAVYNVTIHVVDNNNGQLAAQVDNGGKSLVFTNTYTEPAKPDNDNDGGSSSGGSGSSSPSQVQVSSAQTGDDTNILLPLIGICVSGAVLGICAVVIYNRKKKTE